MARIFDRLQGKKLTHTSASSRAQELAAKRLGADPVLKPLVQAIRTGLSRYSGTVSTAGSGRQMPTYATRGGQFVRASAEHIEKLRTLFLEAAKTNFKTTPNGTPSRFRFEDLALNFNGIGAAEKLGVLKDGLKGIAKTVLYTSGAGLWERGMNQPKALIPYNLVDLLPPARFDRLTKLSDINSAKTDADVLFIAGVKETSDLAGDAARIREEAKAEAEQILSEVKKDPRSLNPLVMKFAKAATLSKASGSFVPLLVGTSEQTHAQIFDFYQQFRQDFANRPFHPDPKVQKEVASAMAEWFKMADEQGYEPIFGRQEGIKLLDEAGLEVEGSQAIGEGAGSAKAYMDHAGLTKKFQEMGKDRWQFENIEVMTDQLGAAGAHERAGKRLSVMLVPQVKGYAGGNPFIVEKEDGRRFLELHEQSAVPAELAEGNAVFNTNTITMPLDLGAPENPGFEQKRGGYRIKLNVGNITQDVQLKDTNATAENVGTAGIGGEIGTAFENLKTYQEYALNGGTYVRTHQDLLARDLGFAPSNVVEWK